MSNSVQFVLADLMAGITLLQLGRSPSIASEGSAGNALDLRPGLGLNVATQQPSLTKKIQIEARSRWYRFRKDPIQAELWEKLGSKEPISRFLGFFTDEAHKIVNEQRESDSAWANRNVDLLLESLSRYLQVSDEELLHLLPVKDILQDTKASVLIHIFVESARELGLEVDLFENESGELEFEVHNRGNKEALVGNLYQVLDFTNFLYTEEGLRGEKEITDLWDGLFKLFSTRMMSQVFFSAKTPEDLWKIFDALSSTEETNSRNLILSRALSFYCLEYSEKAKEFLKYGLSSDGYKEKCFEWIYLIQIYGSQEQSLQIAKLYEEIAQIDYPGIWYSKFLDVIRFGRLGPDENKISRYFFRDNDGKIWTLPTKHTYLEDRFIWLCRSIEKEDENDFDAIWQQIYFLMEDGCFRLTKAQKNILFQLLIDHLDYLEGSDPDKHRSWIVSHINSSGSDLKEIILALDLLGIITNRYLIDSQIKYILKHKNQGKNFTVEYANMFIKLRDRIRKNEIQAYYAMKKIVQLDPEMEYPHKWDGSYYEEDEKISRNRVNWIKYLLMSCTNNEQTLARIHNIDKVVDLNGYYISIHDLIGFQKQGIKMHNFRLGDRPSDIFANLSWLAGSNVILDKYKFQFLLDKPSDELPDGVNLKEFDKSWLRGAESERVTRNNISYTRRIQEESVRRYRLNHEELKWMLRNGADIFKIGEYDWGRFYQQGHFNFTDEEVLAFGPLLKKHPLMARKFPTILKERLKKLSQ